MLPLIPIEFAIDGVVVRSPKIGGMSRKPEAVWSKNTGRTGTAKMQGTIIAIKQTLSLSWAPMPAEEAERLEKLISNKSKPFHTIKWTTPTGSTKEMACYFGTPTFEEYDLMGGIWCCKNIKVDAIER